MAGPGRPGGKTCSIGHTWTQAQHPPEAAAEREPLHAPTRALLLLLLRKACRTSTLATARNGPAPQRAAGRGKKKGFRLKRIGNKQKRGSRDNSPKRASRAPSPHTRREAGKAEGRTTKKGGGGGGGGRGRTTASASPAAVGLHGIVAQGVGGGYAAHSPGGLPGWDASQFLVIPKYSSNARATRWSS